MANIEVKETNSQLGEAWKHLGDIKLVYADILGLTKVCGYTQKSLWVLYNLQLSELNHFWCNIVFGYEYW